MILGNFKFLGVPSDSINLEGIKRFMADDENAKRIHFATTHSHALRKETAETPYGWFNIPFDKTVGPILKKELGSGFKLFRAKTTGKIYRRVDTEREFLEIQSFIDKFKNIVFLRDCLDLSISLSMNMSDSKQRTELGALEYLVKYRADEIDYQQIISDIIQICQETLEKLPYFKEVDYVCVIPSSHPFMKDIVRGLKGFVFEDISDNVSWEKSSEIKNAATLDEKLEALLKSNLKVSEAVDLKGKNVMLVDDLYNSGLTMQYVAMRLKELGVCRVFGVTLVKSLSNK